MTRGPHHADYAALLALARLRLVRRRRRPHRRSRAITAAAVVAAREPPPRARAVRRFLVAPHPPLFSSPPVFDPAAARSCHTRRFQLRLFSHCTRASLSLLVSRARAGMSRCEFRRAHSSAGWGGVAVE